MPQKTQMDNIKGKKEGEIRVFMDGQKGQAYCWQEGNWNLIGDVIDQQNTMGKRQYGGDKFFPAGEYDFIFDVDDESGTTKLLPFNKGDNHLTTAEKFITRENLPMEYKE